MVLAFYIMNSDVETSAGANTENSDDKERRTFFVQNNVVISLETHCLMLECSP